MISHALLNHFLGHLQLGLSACWRSIGVTSLSFCAAILVWLPMPSAEALVSVNLSDLSYAPCTGDVATGLVSAGSSATAKCFIIHGTTTNKSGKPVINADIFGRIFDANHNDVFPNRHRIGTIDEIQPGTGEFDFRVTIEANLAEPLQFEGFKASGFTGKVRR